MATTGMVRTVGSDTVKQLATKWRPWIFERRYTAYVDVPNGTGMYGEGGTFNFTPNASLRKLVASLSPSVEMVYLCGELPAASQAGQAGVEHGGLCSPFNSWLLEAQPELKRLDSGTLHDASVVRVRRSDASGASGGQLVEVRPISVWLAVNAMAPKQAADALARVGVVLRYQFGQDVCLLATPALTGRELWRHSIGRGIDYEILPEAVRTRIHHTSGQGRFELLPPPPNLPDGMAPSLVYLDGRLAYAAPCLEELGIGPVTHDSEPAYAGFTPARYRVAFRIPDAWAHVGLLMVPLPWKPGGAGWHFPRIAGTRGETWADAAEMRIAYAPFPHACPECAERYRDNDGVPCSRHGWSLTIQERIVFTKGRPLRTWAEKLLAAREACRQNPRAQAALRAILLHGIGQFHGVHPLATHTTQDSADVPDKIPVDTTLTPDGEYLYSWQEPGETPRFPDYDRPELSAQVWARARARLLLHRDINGTFTGALTRPFEEVVAMRLDALYLTANPHWPDSGKPGVLRVKGVKDGPIPWPREESDLTAVKEQVEGSVP